ncbi:short-chain dehydrogenase [Purpureocillium lavendulum]|uniref:Short-chain dehydrogenase n=1 Tax=Purpureocillium lavendulum TaxID=1247861 RepID=A0AB34FSC5_9HYPO|nr:short-chain dehydrogenase [Purpureocillium lavendulum]
MGNTYSQFFPPAPQLTEANLPSQEGKVFVVTGGYSGIGLALSRMLYRAGGSVYVAGRNETKALEAISQMKVDAPGSSGKLTFLKVALDDLPSVKVAAQQFMDTESRLDVLFNNAGVSSPPKGSVSAQGFELQMATNCLGPYLFTQLLVPLLLTTAKTAPPATVRVVFTSSITTDHGAPTGGASSLAAMTTPSSFQQNNYTHSKTGNWFLASELARQVGPQGVLSVAHNPGNLKTPLQRHFPPVLRYVIAPLLYEPRFGAYTELWAGLSRDLVMEDGGKHIEPWGRLHPNPRPDLLLAMKSKDEGGTGLAAEFAEWCDRMTAEFR